VEVLSVTLQAENADPSRAVISTENLENLLKTALKDEVYRIKAVLTASKPIIGSDEDVAIVDMPAIPTRYILNWAFGRWTFTPFTAATGEHESSNGIVLRMTMILARYESTKWKKKMETNGFIELEGKHRGILRVEKIV